MEDVPLFPEAPAVTVERTLAIIKPDVIHLAEKIVEEIKSQGFTILQVGITGTCILAIDSFASGASYLEQALLWVKFIRMQFIF